MAPARRQSSGRSPLVNPQRQITSFFSKTTSSPSPILPKQSPKTVSDSVPKNPKCNPNPSPSSSPGPTTPSPLQSKSKKPLLVIGSSPSTPDEKRSYGEDSVGRRVKIFWPLDKVWYEGSVKSFDKDANKHLVQYDDAEEELLDLEKEKIEWVDKSGKKKLKRLRRGSSDSKDGEEVEIVKEEECVEEFRRPRRRGGKVVVEDEEVESDGGGVDGHDDSSDEDWGKNVEEEVVEDGEDDMDLEEEEDEGVKASKGKRDGLKKRKVSEGEKLGSAKKSKNGSGGGGGGVGKGGLKVSSVEPAGNGGKASNDLGNALMGDASERFGMREALKFRFLGEERRDAKRRRPGEANYDPRTLYLPPDFLKSLSGGQRQWWEFKSKHMDKVLFFKMGKFYELFEMDAHIGSKELDLQYMKGEQPHCGFPEKNFSMNVEKLARKGYRVLVVEQTETPEQLELRRKEKGSKDKVVKREICAVVSKGTLTEGEMLSANPDASYVMAVAEGCKRLVNQKADRIFGVCVVDVATSRVILGQFGDDTECTALCCLLSELRPVEIVKPAKQLSPETERVLLRHTRNPLVNELVPLLEFWEAEKTVHEVKSIYSHIVQDSVSGSLNEANLHCINSHIEENGLGYLPDVLSELVKAGENGSFALSALGGTLFYLKQAFLDETLLRFAKFELLPCSGFGNIVSKPYMVLDAAALENLEIFENSRNGDSSGTLYSQLNHCVTAFGKRLLKTWLARPLYHPESIRERQDAVSGLRGANLAFALEFRKALSRLPDMERLLARVFAISEANGRNANKVILYEDAAKKQLQEFISALRGCELTAQACSSLGVILESVESRVLHHLLTPGNGFPDINSVINHFKGAFDWVEANNSGRIIPHEGVDAEYDSSCKKVKEVEFSLTKHLKEQRKLLGDASITYVTVGKEAYLLEVPESLRGSIPRDYELRSSKKGFFRYWTPNIKKLVGELSQAESEKESSLKSILQRLIGHFCEHHDKWRQLVSATAELDVLISLAIASDYYEGPTCRPSILGSSNPDEVPCLSAKNLGHPVLRSDSLGKGTFVPNDVSIGGSDHASFILLTGPNMGGKSTLLRQVCLAVILAQVGADVPAESFELSSVDRIFVRMGAKDHIMAGQSTFLTELSETALMLSSATRNSLVALDELGRGTSTSDGQAIAESVLQHFVHKVQCRGMFSTHYHRLAVDYQKDPKVSLCHMACRVGNRVGDVEEVTFLYRLTPGECPKSYGVNVAWLAGLPDSVLQNAAAKSREFEGAYGKHWKKFEDGLSNQSLVDEMVEFVQKFMDIAANLSWHKSPESIGTSSLTELQHRAQILLQKI
ncbi:DNA mismatch repair protein MSH6 [Alnus glutinosa]|uniref:DNA mismatch repair protein MSH6 n=1 Tax=Alnus glutinosa TaxID=3517 RepID=UPI002D782D97|nr:DNA mismatch repair protein MSH6 [Alnus glutinosa]